jgi:hypothetical protein
LRERIKIHVVFVHGIGVLDQRKVFVQAVIIPSSLGIPDRQYLLRHFVPGHISRFRTCVLRLILQLARNPHTRQNHNIELLIHHSFFMHLHLLLIHILAANEIPPIALQSSARPDAAATTTRMASVLSAASRRQTPSRRSQVGSRDQTPMYRLRHR